MRTPATFYQPSNRTYPRKLESPEYPADWLVHRVRLRTIFVAVNPGRCTELSGKRCYL